MNIYIDWNVVIISACVTFLICALKDILHDRNIDLFNFNEPVWVVNNIGELGVKIKNRYFFFCDGNSFEYKATHYTDGCKIMVRRVAGSEFGEFILPKHHKQGDKYLKIPDYCDSRYIRRQCEWKPIGEV